MNVQAPRLSAPIHTNLDRCTDALFEQYTATEPDEGLIEALEAEFDRLSAAK